MAVKKPAPKDVRSARVLIATHNPEAKVFTSDGPLVCGSVVTLPADEAARLVDQKVARYTEEGEARIEPLVNVEGGLAPNVNPD